MAKKCNITEREKGFHVGFSEGVSWQKLMNRYDALFEKRGYDLGVQHGIGYCIMGETLVGLFLAMLYLFIKMVCGC